MPVDDTTRRVMNTFARFPQKRRVIQDFTSTALAGIPNPFARLACVASLKPSNSDSYQHTGLAAVYGEEAMRQALTQCHEELFERILESPWLIQVADLRGYLSRLPQDLRGGAADWRTPEAYRELVPLKSPDYLRELFCSNIRAMLDIILAEG
jgi:hypothetical protein